MELWRLRMEAQINNEHMLEMKKLNAEVAKLQQVDMLTDVLRTTNLFTSTNNLTKTHTTSTPLTPSMAWLRSEPYTSPVITRVST